MKIEEILKAEYESHVKKYPATNWMSWEEACADHSMDVALSAMRKWAMIENEKLWDENEELRLKLKIAHDVANKIQTIIKK